MNSLSAQAERAITFYSAGQPSFLLEGVLHKPIKVEHAPVVVLCHPQPASSDMQDPLTAVLAQSLAAEAGMIALRFYFRGGGESPGQQTDGRVEPPYLARGIHIVPAPAGGGPGKVCGICPGGCGKISPF